MIGEVNDLAGQRELISEYLEAEVSVCVCEGVVADMRVWMCSGEVCV